MIILFEDFLNEYNVASSGIITMYNLDPETKKRLETLGATVKEENRSGKDVTYEVSFATKALGDDILNLLQEVDPLPMPDMVHLYPGLFEMNSILVTESKNIYNMKRFDEFEKSISINESEVSFNVDESKIDFKKYSPADQKLVKFMSGLGVTGEEADKIFDVISASAADDENEKTIEKIVGAEKAKKISAFISGEDVD